MMDPHLFKAIKLLPTNQLYLSLGPVKPDEMDIATSLPNQKDLSFKVVADTSVMTWIKSAERLLDNATVDPEQTAATMVGAYRATMANYQIFRPDVDYFIFTIRCDKNNNVGLAVKLEDGVPFFTAPMDVIRGDAIDEANTFEIRFMDRRCVKIEYDEIYSEPYMDPVFKVPPRAFAAMLLEKSPNIMHHNIYHFLKGIFNKRYYWAMPRLLPELEGADLEESLSLARHYLHITSLPGCSIRAPVKPDVVH
jgi:hypothetical protein